MTITAIDLPMQEIAQFCDRWQVIEFTLQSLVITQLDLLLPAKREMYLRSWATGFGED